MNVQEAIMAFSQSEKIKSGLIWISQTLELLQGLDGMERVGGEKTIKAIVDMVANEIQLAKSITGDMSWGDVDRHIDQAVVMINSGVVSESLVHITKALSQVTNVGSRSMTFLREQELL